VTLRVERDSMPPGSPYKRDSHASAVLPSCHVETRCMGFLGAKIERFPVPIEIERESEKRINGQSSKTSVWSPHTDVFAFGAASFHGMRLSRFGSVGDPHFPAMRTPAQTCVTMLTFIPNAIGAGAEHSRPIVLLVVVAYAGSAQSCANGSSGS
jgi:hypothetical protein